MAKTKPHYRPQHHVVDNLREARMLSSRPGFIPKPRCRGTAAMGLAYQRKLKKALPQSAKAGVWFEFTDRSGKHYCEVDWLLLYSGHAIIIETKLTRIGDACAQLLELYRPVVECATKRKTICVAIAKSLSRWDGSIPVHNKLTTAVAHCVRTNEVGLVHWIGTGKL